MSRERGEGFGGEKIVPPRHPHALFYFPRVFSSS